MSDPAASGLSAGEIGGIFAGLVALLAALGKAAAWLLNWNDARVNSRSAKLQRWHEELTERETRIDAQVNARLNTLETSYERLNDAHSVVLQRLDRSRMAYRVIAAELIEIAPHSAALVQAQMILTEPFPTDALVGGEDLVRRIDEATSG